MDVRVRPALLDLAALRAPLPNDMLLAPSCGIWLGNFHDQGEANNNQMVLNIILNPCFFGSNSFNDDKTD